VPGAQFVFAGPMATGEERIEIENACRAAEQTGGVSFPGLVAGLAKLDLLERASIFILPSYHENFPVAILEAMAMGLPVVSTRVAGIPDVVEDGCNGFLIDPGDYRALADRILQLARNRDLREAMGQANVAKVRSEYHPDLFTARMRDVYISLLADGRRDGAAIAATAESMA
jgi:glycosyltransferase involved in cell wall biosynthesis